MICFLYIENFLVRENSDDDEYFDKRKQKQVNNREHGKHARIR